MCHVDVLFPIIYWRDIKIVKVALTKENLPHTAKEEAPERHTTECDLIGKHHERC